MSSFNLLRIASWLADLDCLEQRPLSFTTLWCIRTEAYTPREVSNGTSEDRLGERTDGRYQVTSDQYNGYVGAMGEHFGQNVDFGQLHKIYSRLNTDGWYGGGQVIGAVPHVKIGRPDWSRISTSHIERANLSVRMHLRRLTRLTNAFSKKLENLQAAVTLYVAFYNFCRVHQTLKATPAMAAGLTDHIWSLQELLG